MIFLITFLRYFFLRRKYIYNSAIKYFFGFWEGRNIICVNQDTLQCHMVTKYWRYTALLLRLDWYCGAGYINNCPIKVAPKFKKLYLFSSEKFKEDHLVEYSYVNLDIYKRLRHIDGCVFMISLNDDTKRAIDKYLISDKREEQLNKIL